MKSEINAASAGVVRSRVGWLYRDAVYQYLYNGATFLEGVLLGTQLFE
jgi:hypothetical protein